MMMVTRGSAMTPPKLNCWGFGRHGVWPACGVGHNPLMAWTPANYTAYRAVNAAFGPMATPVRKHPICLSIGLLACNEQDTLRATLEALFRQSIFEKMWSRHEQC